MSYRRMENEWKKMEKPLANLPHRVYDRDTSDVDRL
jgi:hypothetical protein